MSGKSKNSQEIRWRSIAPGNIAWVDWGNDHIAYHRCSGITHFLNLSSKQLVTEILREPLGLDDVMQAFGSENGDADWDDRRVEMAQMLERLEHLGFLERP